jgi:long-chain acyl-CoA synthetase
VREHPAVDPRVTVTLGDVIRQQRRSRPRLLAVVDGDRRLDYHQLDVRVNRLASSLGAAGVGVGDRILWLGQNSSRVLELLLAAAKLGAMLCPVNWRQSVDELAFVIEDLDAAVVVWLAHETGAAVLEARDRTGGPGLWLQHDSEGPESYEELLAAGTDDDPDLPVDAGAPALLLYTAADSGRPNGSMLSHRALLTQTLVMGGLFGARADAVFLNSGPLFHVANWWSTLITLVFGGTNVFTPRVDAEELCRLIESERCTGAFLVPPTIDQIVELNRDGRFDLTSLRASAGAGPWAEMVTADDSPWAKRPGGYGQTEVVGMLTFNALGEGAVGTHGRPSPVMQVAVLGPDGDELPPGEVGEIVARGPTVMNGYWNRPALNAQRQAGDWHHTHDLGRVEEDGSLSFIGRKSRMIKSAAENIYPAEVEGCIRTHPGVADVGVIGIPDPVWTQSVKAIVVRAEGSDVGADDIIEHCRQRIASYKKPRSVEFVDALPRQGFAVDYDALDARVGGGGYPGGANRSA